MPVSDFDVQTDSGVIILSPGGSISPPTIKLNGMTTEWAMLAGVSSTGNSTWTDVGVAVDVDPSSLAGNFKLYFNFTLEVSNGSLTVEARLYNLTSSSEVSFGGTISTSNTSATSYSLSLYDGSTLAPNFSLSSASYVTQIKLLAASATDVGIIKNAIIRCEW